ncbi:hypothetical protein MAR_034529 [Mya arenaria]|uniref:Uncharacterized protein n=1 Tax=Mya arenaria TaxID=6604 RepID=A0ABY7GC69_MYAAR|nr:hypothetical protein MAR_034529 [Mya arenaria]
MQNNSKQDIQFSMCFDIMTNVLVSVGQEKMQLKKKLCDFAIHLNDETAFPHSNMTFGKNHLKMIWNLQGDVSVNIKNIGAEKNDRLIGNLTTNLAENWMAIRAKFDGGKQIYRCQRCSWGLWGALRKPLGPAWSPMVFQEVTGCEPGSYFFNNARHPEKNQFHARNIDNQNKAKEEIIFNKNKGIKKQN